MFEVVKIGSFHAIIFPNSNSHGRNREINGLLVQVEFTISEFFQNELHPLHGLLFESLDFGGLKFGLDFIENGLDVLFDEDSEILLVHFSSAILEVVDDVVDFLTIFIPFIGDFL